MEWNTKWDWENFGGYTSKAVESDVKKSDWVVIDDGGGGSSAKSSISASTDSGKMGFSTASVGNAEGLLGLKLGKRTYFENSGVIPCPPSATTTKKTKSSSQNGPPICCQVEGCNIDLSKAKEYHRKHRVCDAHSKSHRVVVGGRERRFCQQCSRFHSLSEFDEKKRSCRRRLSDHNARRRKPQQETIQFDPTRHAAPYYGGNQQMSFVLNNSSLVRTPGNCGWDSACNSKFTLTTQGYSFKYVDDQPLHMPGLKPLQGVVYTPNGLLPPKNSALLVPNPAPEFARALSLLSSNSWDSCEPESIPSHHQIHQTDSGIMQPMAHEGVPLSSSEFWLSGQHSTNSHVPSNSNFQEIQLKTPYDANFYSNILN